MWHVIIDFIARPNLTDDEMETALDTISEFYLLARCHPCYSDDGDLLRRRAHRRRSEPAWTGAF
ncbi:hypothetical protein CIP107547_00958 [Corynebacterium diphtheriae]|uniref:Uncharacterized protein n=2 Tax=Corynebacterium diphtheriae TaxID=1717 RepID=A0A811G424_CORDP|nr:hypothetical protein CIP107514_00682 [Corynebacterium diphtheriae]CAB0595149.1 hypothetical protein CIP107547_00958 [Corynebacterium diphtheriae]